MEKVAGNQKIIQNKKDVEKKKKHTEKKKPKKRDERKIKNKVAKKTAITKPIMDERRKLKIEALLRDVRKTLADAKLRRDKPTQKVYTSRVWILSDLLAGKVSTTQETKKELHNMDPRRRMERKIKKAIREVEVLVRQQESGKTLKKKEELEKIKRLPQYQEQLMNLEKSEYIFE